MISRDKRLEEIYRMAYEAAAQEMAIGMEKVKPILERVLVMAVTDAAAKTGARWLRENKKGLGPAVAKELAHMLFLKIRM